MSIHPGSENQPSPSNFVLSQPRSAAADAKSKHVVIQKFPPRCRKILTLGTDGSLKAEDSPPKNVPVFLEQDNNSTTNYQPVLSTSSMGLPVTSNTGLPVPLPVIANSLLDDDVDHHLSLTHPVRVVASSSVATTSAVIVKDQHADPAQTSRKNARVQRKRNLQNADRGCRKCNCTRSACLKLYCDCFAAGKYCDSCNCKDCHNTPAYADERSRAIKTCIDRNPNAFTPKIGPLDQHYRGCQCKKSGCLKNYCECFEAKVSCSSRCKCKDCQNTDCHGQRRHPSGTETQHTVQPHFSQHRVNAASDSAALDWLPPSAVQKDNRQFIPAYATTLRHVFTDSVIESFAQCLLLVDSSSQDSTAHQLSLLHEFKSGMDSLITACNQANLSSR